MTALLDIKNIECRYQGQTVISELSFHINQGDIACLLGPSGCGKTTALRAIAGLEPINSGSISLRAQKVSTPGNMLAPEKRKLGMVFQDYALFPHLCVYDNITFGLRKMGKIEKLQRADELLTLVNLAGFGKRYPHELSGGQQQRIALARAIANKPDLLLLDEPFSNLDIDLREKIGYEIRSILKKQGITALLVTHDQQEAFALGDVIGVMNEGRILQWDTPFNLYHEPTNHFVANFIGQGVFLKGTLLASNLVKTDIGEIQGNRAYPWPIHSNVEVLIRPDDIIADAHSELRAEVVDKAFKGAEIMYTLKLASGSRVLSLFPSHFHHNIGDQVGIRIAADHLVAFPAS
ncbi:MAG: ABC transporter ATP-binding protein [Thiotrichales bacterium]|nr:MAG: ABC transporter ATP-binding protein [Thiotrichales bacterium]